MRCSIDLRKGVLEFVKSGGSKSEAARRFKVSRAGVYDWLKSKEALTYKAARAQGASQAGLVSPSGPCSRVSR